MEYINQKAESDDLNKGYDEINSDTISRDELERLRTKRKRIGELMKASTSMEEVEMYHNQIVEIDSYINQ